MERFPLTTDHLTEQLLRCVPKEGSAAHQELVQDDPHGPPVHRLPVALTQDHLWSDVLRCTTDLQMSRGVLKLVFTRTRFGFYSTEEAIQYLLVQELPRVFLDVSLVQVGGETHQTDLREAEVRQLDVTQ